MSGQVKTVRPDVEASAMDVADIKKRLAKPATRFFAGGFRPTNHDDESWIGKVFLYRPDESLPVNAAGATLFPYAQFYLPNLPFVSPLLTDVSVLTLFVSDPFPDYLEEMGNNWVIREYNNNDVLVRKDISAPGSFLKPFPLRPEYVPSDFPLWDSECIPHEIEKAVLQLERAGTIDSYYDVIDHAYEHKIGGYPSFCQSGIDPGQGFEFVFQISSDEKANLNVVDNGSLMFWKHRESGKWVIYYDFC